VKQDHEVKMVPLEKLARLVPKVTMATPDLPVPKDHMAKQVLKAQQVKAVQKVPLGLLV